MKTLKDHFKAAAIEKVIKYVFVCLKLLKKKKKKQGKHLLCVNSCHKTSESKLQNC